MRLESLNSILKLKGWKKDQIETEISSIQRVINDHEERLRIMENELALHLYEFRDRNKSDVLRPDLLRSFHAYMEGMNERMGRERDSIFKRLQELKDKREKLVSVYKEKMVVEKLRERHISEEVRADKRVQRKELDFISLRWHKR